MPKTKAKPSILIACTGNVLRGDDGFGIEVGKKLIARKMPSSVEIMDVGIGGLSLVQKLFEGYDALIIVDATYRGGKPGTLYLLEPEIPEIDKQNMDLNIVNYLADQHYVEPTKVLTLAKGLGILPEKVLILGCEPAKCEDYRLFLSRPVKNSVERAVKTITSLVKKSDKSRITNASPLNLEQV